MPLFKKNTQVADDFDAAPTRLYSLDALRGFDMFWIMGADELLYSISHATNSPFWNAVATQFTPP